MELFNYKNAQPIKPSDLFPKNEEERKAMELWNAITTAIFVSGHRVEDVIFLGIETIEPERKKGRWINGKCSECGEPKPISKIFDRGELVWDRENHINYCNNCGAEMEKGEE